MLNPYSIILTCFFFSEQSIISVVSRVLGYFLIIFLVVCVVGMGVSAFLLSSTEVVILLLG